MDRVRRGLDPRCLLALLVFIAGCGAPSIATPGRVIQTPSPGGQDAVPAVLAAFMEHRVVAIGDLHNDGFEYTFIEDLISDPGFVAQVSVIGLGWGNARYQDAVDRYIRGDDQAGADLQRALDSSGDGVGTWAAPIYRTLFDLIRIANRAAAPGHGLQVILGEPPMGQGVITEDSPCDASHPSCADYWSVRRAPYLAAQVVAAVGAQRKALIIANTYDVIHSPGQADPSVSDLVARQLGGLQVWEVLPLGQLERRALVFGPPLHGRSEVYPLAGTALGNTSEERIFGHIVITCDVPPCVTAEPPRPLDHVADALLDVAR